MCGASVSSEWENRGQTIGIYYISLLTFKPDSYTSRSWPTQPPPGSFLNATQQVYCRPTFVALLKNIVHACTL